MPEQKQNTLSSIADFIERNDVKFVGFTSGQAAMLHEKAGDDAIRAGEFIKGVTEIGKANLASMRHVGHELGLTAEEAVPTSPSPTPAMPREVDGIKR